MREREAKPKRTTQTKRGRPRTSTLLDDSDVIILDTNTPSKRHKTSANTHDLLIHHRHDTNCEKTLELQDNLHSAIRSLTEHTANHNTKILHLELENHHLTLDKSNLLSRNTDLETELQKCKTEMQNLKRENAKKDQQILELVEDVRSVKAKAKNFAQQARNVGRSLGEFRSRMLSYVAELRKVGFVRDLVSPEGVEDGKVAIERYTVVEEYLFSLQR